MQFLHLLPKMTCVTGQAIGSKLNNTHKGIHNTSVCRHKLPRNTLVYTLYTTLLNSLLINVHIFPESNK